jgi:ribosomal protein S6--L-glutamate ligase
MRIGILTTRDESYPVNARLLAAGRKEGHAVRLVHPLECRPFIDGSGQLRLAYEGGGKLELDVLLPRIGSTIDDFELTVAAHLEAAGVCLLNTAGAVNIARDKFRTLQALAGSGIDVPRTELLHRGSDPSLAVQSLGGFPLVLKPRRGRKGRGVMLVEDENTLAGSLAALGGAGEAVLLQEFIHGPDLRDLRVIVIRGKVIAAVLRKPPAGDFRSNIGQGGEGRAVELTPREIAVAEQAAAAVKLDVAGVDLFSFPQRTFGLETNYTPGLVNVEAVSGVDVSRAIIRAAAGKFEERRPAP